MSALPSVLASCISSPRRRAALASIGLIGRTRWTRCRARMPRACRDVPRALARAVSASRELLNDARGSPWPQCVRRLVFLALLAESGAGIANSAQSPDPVPSFAELQIAGAVVGRITINNQNVFDLDDPKESNLLFRTANALHVKTRPEVIQQSLLFHSGEPVSVRLIEETERLLRCRGYLYDVSIRPVAYHDGVADIEVTTRDTWTLEPGLSFSRAGGANSGGIALKEENLLGTGLSVGVSHTSDVDRSGTDFSVAYDHAFDGWTRIGYSIGALDDGERQTATLVHPFYSLDSRWAAGVVATKDNRIESTYEAGQIANQYRHRQQSAEAFGGLSAGLIDGWTQRYSVGLAYLDDKFALEPGLTAPAVLPPDQILNAPFVRYELIEDDFQVVKNRNQIARAETVAMGLHAQVQLGRALQAIGSTRDLWLYSASVEKGFQVRPKDTLMTSGSLSGQYGDGRVERLFVAGGVQYYRQQSDRALFYASVSGAMLRNPQPEDMLMLGGDNGLRGYPLRYQTGDQRALVTLEQRVYTDWYPLRLFRVGGAVFFDAGRAWGGDLTNTENPGWLSDAGFGLRILNCRSALGNVLHADIAFPLNGNSNIQSVQFLLRSRATF